MSRLDADELLRSTADKYSRGCKISGLIASRPVCTPEHLPIRLERISSQFSPLLKQSCVVLQLQQRRRYRFRARHGCFPRDRKARRFGAGGDNTYEFRVHQEVHTASCQAVTFATNLLGSSERSTALQVLCCAPGGRAFGSLNASPITAHG